MESQNKRLLKYLKKFKRINPLESWVELSIYRLAARISDLRTAGHKIEMKIIAVENQFGEMCRFAEYKIK